MTHGDATLSPSLIAQALDPPTRLAPLSALTAELRRPGIWVALCRTAARDRPAWLEERLAPDDLLLRLLASQGERPLFEAARARAVCELALAHCGRRPEGPALAAAAVALGEQVPAADFATLDAIANPRLSDLLAEIRSPRRGRTGRARTVVVDARGAATRGSAIVTAVAGRAPGLRDDVTMRLFAHETATRRLTAALGRAPRKALLARVEDDDGWPAGGDACQAALLAACWSATGTSPAGERLIVGAIGETTAPVRLQPGEAPPWPDVVAMLPDDARSHRAPLVPSAASAPRGEVAATPAALRRALLRRRRRRRAGGLAGAIALAAGVGALLVGGGSSGTDRSADRLAARAESLLTSDPGAAALTAARALSLRRDDATVHAALAVTAQGRLTLAAGQERGRLLAVGIDDDGTITTVSSAGRATRWSLRSGRPVPLMTIRIPKDEELIATSRAGRWLLMTTDHFGSGLLIDASARVPTRRVVLPDQLMSAEEADAARTVAAIGDGARPVIAIVDPEQGLMLDDGRVRRPIDVAGAVTALGFSPDGRRLAVGLASGLQLILDGRDGTVLRGPVTDFDPEDLAPGAITHIDVDDRGTTVTQRLGTIGSAPYGPVWRWRTGRRLHDMRYVRAPTNDPVVLGGRGLVLAYANGTLEVQDERHAGASAAVVQRLPLPTDPQAKRALATAPTAGLAVVASPTGRFTVLDLRRIVEPDREILPSSVSFGSDGLRAVGRTGPTALGLLRWRPDATVDSELLRPLPRMVLAGVSADGRRLIVSTKGIYVLVLDSATARTLYRLTIPGRPYWGPVALDAHGDVAAAFNQDGGRVIVWRLSNGGAARVLARTQPTPSSHPRFPEPLALASSGDYVVHGNSSRLLLTDVATGRGRHVPTPARAEVIRARFGSGDRLAISTTRGALLLSGPGWHRVVTVADSSSYDAVPIRDGVVTASIDGVRLRTPTGSDIVASDSEAADGTRPGTIEALRRPASIVPEYGAMPLAALRLPSADVARLCRLAGRSLAAGRCAPAPSLPEPDAAPAGGPLSSDAVLAADGLGPLRLGAQLPADVEDVAGYAAGPCDVRALPGLAAAVVTRADRVESIALFSVPYVTDDAPFHADAELMTDLGMIATNYMYLGGTDVYGAPDLRRGTHNVWRLRIRGRIVSTLTVAESPGGPSILLSKPEPRCVVWR